MTQNKKRPHGTIEVFHNKTGEIYEVLPARPLQKRRIRAISAHPQAKPRQISSSELMRDFTTLSKQSKLDSVLDKN